MTKFLYRTAEYLVQNYGESLSEICIVLPNRRAGLYLKKYLAEIVRKTIWAPSVYSVEDFMVRLSHLKLADSVEVLFELYEVHKVLEGEKAQTFDEFMHWGQQLIGDFNEIDSYLVDSAEIFSFLSEAKALTIWNLEKSPLTDFEKQYLHFYNSLKNYHDELSDRLISAGKAYQGLLFRKTAERVPSLISSLEWKKVIFAGFNAMTASEERIVDTLVEAGLGDTLWDADHYYLSDENQEAGYFLRRWKEKWKNHEFRWISDEFRSSAKSIRITGVPLHIGQAKLCGELLSELIEDPVKAEETAVVLMDEKLLIPVMTSLPDSIREMNITMGLSLKQTPLFNLLDAIFRMHLNVVRLSSSSGSASGRFYFQDVIKVLQHPYMNLPGNKTGTGNDFSVEDIIRSLKKGNLVFVGRNNLNPSSENLFSATPALLDPLFESWNTIPEALRHLQSFLSGLCDGLMIRREDPEKKTGPLELEYLFAFSRIIFRLVNLTGKFNHITNLQTLYDLFVQMASFTTLPFYGEPLKGVQVMGMLETRTLDFDNIILLSANEDLLPSGKNSQSFIPYDIRRHFHLPTYKTNYSIFAYHFYRLLQRASSVNLLYNTEPDELGGGEKSRFIKQIIQEMRRYNPSVSIQESILVTTPEVGIKEVRLSIRKTEEIRRLLADKAEKGFSPSSLNLFIQCPLKFCFNDLIRLREPEEISDSIDGKMLGNAIHKVLENLYAPFRMKKLDNATFESMIKSHERVVEQVFIREFNSTELSSGRNHLLLKVAKILVKKYLLSELKTHEILTGQGIDRTLVNLEQMVEKKLRVKGTEGIIPVTLKGFIDRIDRVGEDWVIIDYKSGRVNPDELKPDDWDDLLTEPKWNKVFQLLTYAYLFYKNDKQETGGLWAGIISLRKTGEGLMKISLPKGKEDQENDLITPDELVTFGDILNNVLENIFDFSIPFTQTDERSNCNYCPYINFCGR